MALADITNTMSFKFKATVDTTDTIAGKVYTQSKPDKNLGGGKSAVRIMTGKAEDDCSAIGIVKTPFNSVNSGACFASSTSEGAAEPSDDTYMVHISVLSGTGSSDELLIKVGDPSTYGVDMRPLAIGESMTIPLQHDMSKTYDAVYIGDPNYVAGVSELTVAVYMHGQ